MELLDYLASHPLAFVLCAILLGLLVGSFLNVVVHRLPKMMERNWKAEAREALGLEPEPKQATYNLVLPNSACPRCGHEIRPWENIPLVSYLALGGKCSSCKAAIGKRYPWWNWPPRCFPAMSPGISASPGRRARCSC